MKTTLLIIVSTSIISSAQRGQPTWERMSRHDANKDGKVTKLEFKGPEQAFTRFDANKDGFITEAEMKTVAPKGGDSGRSGKSGKPGRVDNAPAVGTVAPQLKAQKLNLESSGSAEMVDLGAIKKPTVLIFGSYT